MVEDIRGIRQSLSEFTGRLYKALNILLRFCLNFEFIFWVSEFWGKEFPCDGGH